MPYPALPDRAIPYHLDGTVAKIITIADGVIHTPSAVELAELNDQDLVDVFTSVAYTGKDVMLVFFFPEARDIAAIFGLCRADGGPLGIDKVEGSNDTTNGSDGTWVTASAPSGYNPDVADFDSWRKSIATLNFSGVAYQSIRVSFAMGSGGANYRAFQMLHIYGQKDAGVTPDDILFLDAEAADVEFDAPLDFGDRPTGTSLQHQIKIKNASGTLTANNIDITVTDPDDIIRIGDTSSGPWVTTKNIASLAPGVKSAVIYVKCETPVPPTPLEPKRAAIDASVGSWT